MLIVVLVTLVINVLKIFDLIYVISPSESLPNSTVVAVQMYQVAFGGTQDSGLGSALGVLLFILVIPAMIFNIRRLRRDADMTWAARLAQAARRRRSSPP